MSTHVHSSVRSTRTLFRRPTRAAVSRVILMMLVACALMFCAQSVWAQGTVSDSLFVNYGLAQNRTIPITEGPAEGQEGVADVQVSDGSVPLLQSGYIP